MANKKPAASWFLNFSHTACCSANKIQVGINPQVFIDSLIIKQPGKALVVDQAIKNFI